MTENVDSLVERVKQNAVWVALHVNSLDRRQGLGTPHHHWFAAGEAVIGLGVDRGSTVTVIRQDTPDQYHVIENVQTPQGARNMGLDPTNHRLFIVSAKFGPAPSGAAGLARAREDKKDGSGTDDWV